MKITIETADNGWVVTYLDAFEGEDGRFVDINKMIVIEEKEEYTTEKLSFAHAKALKTLLYVILEQLGENGSKHDPFRTYVVIRDQDYKEVEE